MIFLCISGSSVGQLVAFDADKEGTLNSKLIYTIISENLSEQPNSFSIDQTTGEIKALRHLLRKDEKVYNLDVRVSDAGNYRKVLPKHISR